MATAWRRWVLVCLAVWLEPGPALAQPTPDEPPGLAALIDRVVETHRSGEHVPGAVVAVVEHGRVVHLRGYGLADVDRGVPVDPERTRFRIGSVSKALTALAVARLADGGRIGLDDDVNSHLDGLRVDDRFAEPVTPRHLLTHTGGFDQVGHGRNFADPGSRPGLREFLARDLRRIRPPGVMSCYDTYGISLAGLLVESVTGSDYAAAMRGLVFDPLGMARTGVETPAGDRADLAIGYTWTEGRAEPLAYEYYASTPASSIDSTAADMARLLVALLGDGSNEHGRVLGPAAAQQLRDVGFRAHPDFAGFTHGWWERFSHGQRVLEHGGTMRGYSSLVWMVPEHGLGLFVAANRDSETGPETRLTTAVARGLMDRWFPAAVVPTAPRPEPAADVDSARFAGVYADSLFCHARPEGEGWPVAEPVTRFEPDGAGRIRTATRSYVAVGPGTFVSQDGSVTIRFIEDASGRILGAASNVGSPGSTLERLDEHLLDRLHGAAWRADASLPSVGLVHRLNEHWRSAAEAYDAAASRLEPGSLAWAVARGYQGRCLVRLGEAAAAAGPLVAAREALWAIRGGGGPGAGSATGLARDVLVYEIAALCGAGDIDGAFERAELAVSDYGVGRMELGEFMAGTDLFEPMRLDSRFDAWR